MLINSVMFSKMLTGEQVKKLIKSLKSLATEHYQKELNYLDTLPVKQYTINENTIRNFTKILKIINENKWLPSDREKRIKFLFNNYGIDHNKRFVFSKTSDNKHEILPLRICELNHRYYLIGYIQGKSKLYHYRIDLITELEETEYKDLANDETKTSLINSLATKNISQYMSEHIYMFYGDVKNITIEIMSNNNSSDYGGYTLLHDFFGGNWILEKRRQAELLYQLL